MGKDNQPKNFKLKNIFISRVYSGETFPSQRFAKSTDNLWVKYFFLRKWNSRTGSSY